MIGKLKGIVEEIGEDYILLDVGGVCYLVFMSRRGLDNIAAVGEPAILFVETHVREDHIHLFGFNNVVEREWFKLLSTVQGVGAKMALSILGVFSPEELAQAIQNKDDRLLTRVSGVGKKLGVRLVTELEGKSIVMPISSNGINNINRAIGSKADSQHTADVSDIDAQAEDSDVTDAVTKQNIQQEAVSALVNLGYSYGDACNAILAARQKTGADSLDKLIRDGLRELA